MSIRNDTFTWVVGVRRKWNYSSTSPLRRNLNSNAVHSCIGINKVSYQHPTFARWTFCKFPFNHIQFITTWFLTTAEDRKCSETSNIPSKMSAARSINSSGIISFGIWNVMIAYFPKPMFRISVNETWSTHARSSVHILQGNYTRATNHEVKKQMQNHVEYPAVRVNLLICSCEYCTRNWNRTVGVTPNWAISFDPSLSMRRGT